MSIWTRLKDFGPWSRAQRERDLEREIQNHLDLEAEESGHDGARRAFGNATLVKEDVRAAWGWTRVEQLARDVRYGLRQVRRNPAFSGIAIATLALGIGVNTAMFSAVHAVLIRPLPYGDADRLVMIWDDMSRTGFSKHYRTRRRIARRNFPGRSPIGARFQFGRWGSKVYWYTIVGVVKEIRDRGVVEALQPAVYRVHEQADQTGDQPSGIVVRTAVDPASIVPAVRQAIWSVDKNEPVARVQTIEDIVGRQLSVPSQNTTLLSAFALLALLLASLGLYGVLSYAVTQRTNEIGVRMALGATSKDILLSFSRRGLALTLAGLAIGVALAVIAARLMTTLFYGFRPGYIPAVAVVSLILLTVAALACFVPARRASRIDPMIALQHE